MMSEVMGRYAGGYGFLLPIPVSLQNKRILGARYKGTRWPSNIQLLERSGSSGIDGISYIVLRDLERLERRSERQRQSQLERVERQLVVRVPPQLSSRPAFTRGFCVPRTALAVK